LPLPSPFSPIKAYLRSTALGIKQETGPEVFELKSRKFKGQSDKGIIRLARDRETKRHTLLAGPRPSTDLKRMEAVETIGRLELEYPDANRTDLVTLVAKELKVSDRTVWRLLTDDSECQ
jgi:hypothetical protein